MKLLNLKFLLSVTLLFTCVRNVQKLIFYPRTFYDVVQIPANADNGRVKDAFVDYWLKTKGMDENQIKETSGIGDSLIGGSEDMMQQLFGLIAHDTRFRIMYDRFALSAAQCSTCEAWADYGLYYFFVHGAIYRYIGLLFLAFVTYVVDGHNLQAQRVLPVTLSFTPILFAIGSYFFIEIQYLFASPENLLEKYNFQFSDSMVAIKSLFSQGNIPSFGGDRFPLFIKLHFVRHSVFALVSLMLFLRISYRESIFKFKKQINSWLHWQHSWNICMRCLTHLIGRRKLSVTTDNSQLESTIDTDKKAKMQVQYFADILSQIGIRHGK